MGDIYVDGPVFLAILDRDDPGHARAATAWVAALDGGKALATSNYVVVEACGLIQGRLGPEALRAFVEDMLPAVEVRTVTPEQHSTALVALVAARRPELTLVDCTSSLVKRSGADETLA